jgi:hypothetical protein
MTLSITKTTLSLFGLACVPLVWITIAGVVHVRISDFICPVAIGVTLSFVYLRLVPKTSLFPVRDPRLIESLTTIN